MREGKIMLSLDQKKFTIALAKAEMNLSDLARTIGVTRAAVGHYLKSDSIRPVTAGKIARALNVSVEDLI